MTPRLPVVLLVLGSAGCADAVWDYRQMGCGQGETLDLRDGEDRPLFVRSTCASAVDADTCELKLSGLRGGYHARDGDQLRAHEIGEVEVEGPFRSAALLWGEAAAGADVALFSGDYQLEVLRGPTGLDPDAVAPGYGQVAFDPEPTMDGPPRLEVFCADCDVRAIAPPMVRLQLGDGSTATVCVDDVEATVNLEVAGDADVTLLFPAGFAGITLAAAGGHSEAVLIRTGAGTPVGTVGTDGNVEHELGDVSVASCAVVFDDLPLSCARPD